ncbi:phosphatase PAP2 family protein [Modestobacter marinus]|uniref:phosphatase PAP2 family protein n=1 Tax=Modestobacter marinus TaxID=477641 RepID=UPI001C98CBD0|nr:phosphatase PAP2 family protein [Modestobacter marinus]
MRTTRTGRPAAVRPLLVAALAALALVALLGAAVTAGVAPVLSADRSLSAALYAGDDRSRLVATVLQVLTAPGMSAFRAAVLVPVLVWLALRRAWGTAAWVLVAGALVAPITVALKELTGRLRPQFAEGGARYETLSFPSGHSSGVAALVTIVLVLAWPRLTGAARRACVAAGGTLVLVVGLTRVLLGVHYPSDVVGGWALGLGWSLLVVLALGGLPGGRAALPAREEVAP